jgi:MoxR-like ATPase
VALLGPRQVGKTTLARTLATTLGQPVDYLDLENPADLVKLADAAGAELDLVLDLPGARRWAIEIKHGHATTLSKGFFHAVEDVEPERAFVAYSGTERYPKAEGVEVIGLRELAQELWRQRSEASGALV